MDEWEEIALDELLDNVIVNITQNSIDLDPEFRSVLNKNLWKLYE